MQVKQETTEKVMMARDLLGMVLGAEDSINTLCIILVQELLISAKDGKEQTLFDEVLDAMRKNFTVALGQKENKELMQKAYSIAKYAEENPTESQDISMLAAHILEFENQIQMNLDVKGIRQALSTYIKDCKDITDIAESIGLLPKVEAFVESKKNAAKDKKQRVTEFAEKLKYIANTSNKTLTMEGLSASTKSFIKALTENKALLANQPICKESILADSVFIEQEKQLEPIVAEIEKALKAK